MKMETEKDVMSNDVNGGPTTPAKEIGRQFVMQYYTTLSEKPKEVFRFYSHQSYFVLGQGAGVQGQVEIQKAIDALELEDCKARIHTIACSHTINEGLLLQVCGELTTRSHPQRRFMQTFVLQSQMSKKYYVHSDVFQWLDEAFLEAPSGGKAANGIVEQHQHHSVAAAPVEHYNPLVDHNGHAELDTSASPEAVYVQTLYAQHQPVSTLGVIPVPPPPSDYTPIEPEPLVKIDHYQPPTASQPQSYGGVTPPPTASPTLGLDAIQQQQQSVSPVKVGPTTWAKLVGAPTASAPTSGHVKQPAAAPPKRRSNTASSGGGQQHNGEADVAKNASHEPKESARSFGNGHAASGPPGFRVNVSYILKNKMPEQDVAEAELRRAFEKYGEVAKVSFPPQAFSQDQRFAHCNIDMKTKAGQQAVFKAARQDDRRGAQLKLQLECFEFDGEVRVSDRPPMPAGPRNNHSGPPQQNRFHSNNGGNQRGGGADNGAGGPPPRSFGSYRGGNNVRGGGSGFRGGAAAPGGAARPPPSQHNNNRPSVRS